MAVAQADSACGVLDADLGWALCQSSGTVGGMRCALGFCLLMSSKHTKHYTLMRTPHICPGTDIHRHTHTHTPMHANIHMLTHSQAHTPMHTNALTLDTQTAHRHMHMDAQIYCEQTDILNAHTPRSTQMYLCGHTECVHTNAKYPHAPHTVTCTHHAHQIHVCRHTPGTHVHGYTYPQAHTCIYTDAHTHMHTNALVSLAALQVHTVTRLHIHTPEHCLHLYGCTNIHMHTHTFTRIPSHTHIPPGTHMHFHTRATIHMHTHTKH